MKQRVPLLVIFLLVSSIVLTACGEEAQESGEPGVVPNSLQTIEAAIEDIRSLV